MVKYVSEGRNVVVLRTFSKIQGLANLRIGYGLAHKELIDVLQKTRQPFNANGIAQAGALAGILDDEHQRKTRDITIEGCELLRKEFAAMGLEFVPGHANFVLVRVGSGKAVFQALMKKGVIIRDMTAYGLPEWIRVSIGAMEQNRRFLAELKAPRRVGGGCVAGLFARNGDGRNHGLHRLHGPPKPCHRTGPSFGGDGSVLRHEFKNLRVPDGAGSTGHGAWIPWPAFSPCSLLPVDEGDSCPKCPKAMPKDRPVFWRGRVRPLADSGMACPSVSSA